MGLFSRLFWGAAGRHSVETSLRVKLPSSIETPGGSRINVVHAFVVVTCHVNSTGEISISNVTHSRSRRMIIGTNAGGNTTSSRGELFYITPLPRRLVLAAAREEFAKKKSEFRQALDEYARKVQRRNAKSNLAKALNAADKHTAQKLIKAAAKRSLMTFNYTKSNGEKSTRTVVVHKVKGNSVVATEFGSNTPKSFRIDRISDARGD